MRDNAEEGSERRTSVCAARLIPTLVGWVQGERCIPHSSCWGPGRIEEIGTPPPTPPYTPQGLCDTIPFSRNAPLQSRRRTWIFPRISKPQEGARAVPVETKDNPGMASGCQPCARGCTTEEGRV